MRNGQLPEAPNYTNAALVMCMVNLAWILGVIWATFGLPMVVIVSLGLNWLIDLIGRRRAD